MFDTTDTCCNLVVSDVCYFKGLRNAGGLANYGNGFVYGCKTNHSERVQIHVIALSKEIKTHVERKVSFSFRYFYKINWH